MNENTNMVAEVSEKLRIASENVPRVYAAGYEHGYTEGNIKGMSDFWDCFQQNGARTDYSYAFVMWNGEIFDPKHDIVPYTASYMFDRFNTSQGCETIDLAERMEKLGVRLDTSLTNNFLGAFSGANISRIGILDLSSGINMSSVFEGNADMPVLERIDKIVCSENNMWDNSSFRNLSALTYLRFEGVIAHSIGLQWSIRLDKESILSVIKALSPDVTGQVLSLSADAVDAAFETGAGLNDGSMSDVWISWLTTKTNWRIELI